MKFIAVFATLTGSGAIDLSKPYSYLARQRDSTLTQLGYEDGVDYGDDE